MSATSIEHEQTRTNITLLQNSEYSLEEIRQEGFENSGQTFADLPIFKKDHRLLILKKKIDGRFVVKHIVD